MSRPHLVAYLLVLSGCPEANPRVLWLALDQVETRVVLTENEPRPY
jgi:hypothetical protein